MLRQNLRWRMSKLRSRWIRAVDTRVTAVSLAGALIMGSLVVTSTDVAASAPATLPAASGSAIVSVDTAEIDIETVAEAVANEGHDPTVLSEVDTVVAPLSVAEMARLEALPGVTVTHDVTLTLSESTQEPAPWNLSRLDQRFLPVDSRYRYPSTAGQGVPVYVIDSGVSAHSQFADRLTPGATAVSDGLGTGDCLGHGTHVAGTVGSATWGVAKKALIVPVRVFDCRSSTTLSTVLGALDWVIDQHTPGTPGIINLSLAGPRNTVFDAAVSSAVDAGLIVVVAGGNSGADACSESPAAAADALTVGATTAQDARASFSNFGTCLDLFAPGAAIPSLRKDGSDEPLLMSGTSMAAPHVAGVAAILWSADPGLTAESVEQMVVAQAIPGAVSNAGPASPNLLLSNFPGNASELPSAPTGVTARSSGGTSASVTWTTPNNVGSGIIDYVIQFRRGGTSTWLTASDGISARTTAAVSGIQAGLAYDFRVRAESLAGAGPFSAVSALTLPQPPGPPRGLRLESNFLRSTVAWDPPSETGRSAITDYTVQYRRAGSSSWTTVADDGPSADTRHVFRRLTANSPFEVRVRAINADGAGPYSEPLGFRNRR